MIVTCEAAWERLQRAHATLTMAKLYLMRRPHDERGALAVELAAAVLDLELRELSES